MTRLARAPLMICYDHGYSEHAYRDPACGHERCTIAPREEWMSRYDPVFVGRSQEGGGALSLYCFRCPVCGYSVETSAPMPEPTCGNSIQDHGTDPDSGSTIMVRDYRAENFAVDRSSLRK